MSARPWLHRAATPLILAGLLLAAVTGVTVAVADEPAAIGINGGNVPTTAKEFGDHSCAQVPDSIKDNEDGWVFVLPANKWRFSSVTATFTDLAGASQTRGGVEWKQPGAGTSKFYIITPAGWTLESATATVELKDDERPGDRPTRFNLTHTCPGTPEEPEPEPSTTTPSSTTPSSDTSSGESPSSETPTGETPSTPGETSSSPASASPTASDGATTPGDSGGLPITGRSLIVPLLLGLALLVVGAAIMIAARHRRAALAGDDVTD